MNEINALLALDQADFPNVVTTSYDFDEIDFIYDPEIAT